MKNNPTYIWCPRNYNYVHIIVCGKMREDPEVHCPTRCPARQPPDDRGDEERFYPKKKEV